jgi:ketosteroid isomerase-like protein
MLTNRVRVRSLFLLTFCAGIVAFFIASAPTIAGDGDANSKALMALDEEWSKSAATKNVDKIVGYYSDDAIACPPNEPIAKGTAAIKRVWSSYVQDKSFVSISWKTSHAEVAKSGDLGYTAGTYELTMKGADGKPGVEKGKYLCEWRQQKDGSWKAIHDMWNSDSK